MDHILVQLGVFLALAAVLAAIFLYIKQSTIIAYITAGILLGLFKSHIHLEEHIIDVISEIGIILLLFLAGMELNISSLKKKLKVTLVTGVGQVVSFTLIGSVIAMTLIGVKSGVSAVYFGLSLAFSSTIVVIKLLKDRKEMESFHGQTLIGILIMQDIIAVFALVFLNTFGSDASLVTAIGVMLLKMTGIATLMFLLSRYVINTVFKKFAQNPELLFVGSLGYVLGVAAICHVIDFSAEIGAFLAGVTLANIPYKLEIEDKVEPIKNMGVILFFVSLGYNLKFTPAIVPQIPNILLLSVIVLAGTPLLLLMLGYSQKMKVRPVFFMGVMLNQISEFSLILATLCLGAGVFTELTFTIIALASIISVLLSSIAHSFLDKLYSAFKKKLRFIEKHSLKLQDMEELNKLQLQDHIILLEYNEIIDRIADNLAGKQKHLIILDTDPYKIEHIKKHESAYHHAVYADPIDPDIWEELKFEKASLIISGIEKNHNAEMELINHVNTKGGSAKLIVYSDNYNEAREIYQKGADYVIMPELSAAEQVTELLNAYETNSDALKEAGQKQKALILAAKRAYM